jgi:MFS family permease
MTGGHGLDLFAGLIAAIQTSFGPFMAAHLGGQGWSQTQIGTALSISTVTVLLTQFPAGMLVDAARDPRHVARWATLGLGVALLLLTFLPTRDPVFFAMFIQGAASSLMGPTIAAISLALVGRAVLGERLGRNARFASIGNGITAAVIGLTGGYIADDLVLGLIAALVVPAWLALRAIHPQRIALPQPSPDAPSGWREIVHRLRDPRLTVFAVCIGAYHLANAAMLPLAAAGLSRAKVPHTDLIVAISIMMQPLVAALISPAIGRFAEQNGRRGLMLVSWSIVPLQGFLLAILPSPWLLPTTQALAGVATAIFAIMLPLVAADISRGTRRFTLCLSSLSFPVAVGAALSTALAGFIADKAGDAAAFLGLALAGLAGLALLWLAMPETHAPEEHPAGRITAAARPR